MIFSTVNFWLQGSNNNSKLSYRRDNARQLSLRRWRSFKVSDAGTSRWEPLCDFLLVNNINLYILLCTVFKLWWIIGPIFAFDGGVQPLFNSF